MLHRKIDAEGRPKRAPNLPRDFVFLSNHNQPLAKNIGVLGGEAQGALEDSGFVLSLVVIQVQAVVLEFA